jgi:hypothetical protein
MGWGLGEGCCGYCGYCGPKPAGRAFPKHRVGLRISEKTTLLMEKEHGRGEETKPGRRKTATGLSNTFRCGAYVCEMSYRPGGGLAVQWRPAVPTRATFSDADMRQYRAGRAACLPKSLWRSAERF